MDEQNKMVQKYRQLKELCRERTLELSHLIRIVTSNTNVMINNVDSYLNEWF